jgi:hypothetical protein
MNSDEKALLERTLKLSEENHQILLSMQRAARRATIYGFIKVIIVLLPFVIGYFYLEPYFGQAVKNFDSFRSLI